jgi:inner membrane protein
MIFLTHLAFALFLGIIIFFNFQANISSYIAPYYFFSLLLISAIFPDIDIATSTIGKKARPLSYFLIHRGFFHSIICMIIFSLIIFAATRQAAYALVFMLGYSSHLLLDSLNPSGIMLFWPSKIKIKGFFRTGKLFDLLLLLIFSGLSILCLFLYVHLQNLKIF